MTDPNGATEIFELVGQRYDFLGVLEDGPSRVRDLVERLEYSRSTINRALRELEAAGLVERTDEGYLITLRGRLLIETYRRGRQTSSAILSTEVLDPLPTDAPISPAILTDADVYVGDGAPYRLIDRLEGVIRNAEDLRLILPALPDSELLRLCHDRVVEGDLELTVGASSTVLETLRQGFSSYLDAMEASGRCRIVEVDPPPFGLVVCDQGEHDHERLAAVLVFTEDNALYGVILNATPDAVDWAESLHAEVFSSAELDRSLPGSSHQRATSSGSGGTGLEDELSSQSDRVNTSTGGQLSPSERVERQGFTVLTPTYFDRRPPVSSLTAWRVGLELPEVYNGYAVERSSTDTGRSLTDQLVAELLEGTDHAVIGPPGSGKSTICKQVACAWYEADHGPVLYRPGDAGERFDTAAPIQSFVDAADGHALVVVEDATRPASNTVFEVMLTMGDRDDVTFLLDARESEWQDENLLPPDARVISYKNNDVEPVVVPELNERTCRRLINRFESTTGCNVELTPEELLAEVRSEADSDSASGTLPGEFFLLLHRLTTHADPLIDNEQTPSSLTEDVHRTIRPLRQDDYAMDVALLVNSLNAAGISVHAEIVHGLAAAGYLNHRDVRDAIDRLEGSMLFGTGTASDQPNGVRTVHKTWSAVFLDQIVDIEGRDSAVARFGRCLSAVLSLADDPDARAQIEHEFAGQGSALERLRADPSQWADSMVTQLFDLLQDDASLVRLYGLTEHSRIDLPDACSGWVPAYCAQRRGNAFLRLGEPDRARAEFETLAELADSEAVGDRADRFRIESHHGLGLVEREAGSFEAAIDHQERALELARSAGERRYEAESLIKLGSVHRRQGALEEAEACYSEALEVARSIGDRGQEADALISLGNLENARSNLERAEDRYRTGLEIATEINSRHHEALSVGNLGMIAMHRGDLVTAERHFKRSCELRRALGHRRDLMVEYESLGKVARLAGRLEAAEEYLERGLEVSRGVGNEYHESMLLTELAQVAECRGRFDTAETRYEESLACQRRSTGPRGDARLGLGRVARLTGRPDTAAEHLEEALRLSREREDAQLEIRTLTERAALERERDEVDAAADTAAAALDAARSNGFDRLEGRVLAELGRIETARGASERAAARFEDALAAFERNGERIEIASTLVHYGHLAVDEGAFDAAEERFDRARTIAEETGATSVALEALDGLITLHERRGELVSADEYCRRAVTVAAEHGLPDRVDEFESRCDDLGEDPEGVAA